MVIDLRSHWIVTLLMLVKVEMRRIWRAAVEKIERSCAPSTIEDDLAHVPHYYQS